MLPETFLKTVKPAMAFQSLITCSMQIQRGKVWQTGNMW